MLAIAGHAEHAQRVQLWLTTYTLSEAMASKEIDHSSALCEDDIPGASLCGRSASTLTVPALKRWLLCRAAPTKGKKAESVER